MSFTQKMRAKIIARCYKNWDVGGKNILDVGCGNGVVSKMLEEELDLKVYGTDVIDYRKVNILFKKMDKADRLPFPDLSFDCVMFNDILHHSKNIESLLVEGNRVGKQLLVFEDKQSLLLNIVDKVLNSLYSSNKMPCPLNFKTQKEWCLLFDTLSLDYEISEVHYPLWYPFRHMAFRLTKKIKSEKNKF